MITYILTKQSVEKNILDAIKSQTLKGAVEIVVCDYDIKISKRKRIAMAKEECLRRAVLKNNDFTVIHDSDILELRDDNFLTMKNFLISNKDYGAVSLLRERGNGHVCSGVIMIRREALKVIKFDLIPFVPTCFSVMHSLKYAGFKYDYIDKIIRIKHMGNNL